MEDLGALPGGTTAFGNAVNEQGDVVGRSTVLLGGFHAFLWSAGAMTDLGLLPGLPASEAFGVNGSRQVVGAAKSGTRYRRSVRAFLYAGGVMRDLTSLIAQNPGWVVIEARGINDAGQIVGVGRLNGGAQHAVLLTPQ
jgi:probable HAF family extracellular repeat protein